ncbi:MAG: hypothetical protein D6755_00495 [Anaerolineae bacterium]|nr:MAG: hypothetical protein D6755_00495 [Anaerolineae bacterium]
MEKKRRKRKTPWIFLPFIWLWELIAWVIGLTGRLIAAVLGVAFMGIGLLLTVTLVAAPIGIPLAIFGFLLMLRSIF